MGDGGATGQVQSSAAEIYAEFFVPALFGQWPGQLMDAACATDGDDVLDVGCGTGVLARAVARRLDGNGTVTGVDVNEGMLTVARCSTAEVQWRSGLAENPPFADASFDRVLSQFALMFFEDRRAGLSEMARVTRPGGTVTAATWAKVEDSPGYAAMVDLLRRLFGDQEADGLLAPFALGDEAMVAELVGEQPVVTRHHGVARFDSIEAWVHTDVRGWTLADMIDDDQYLELVDAAQRELLPFVDKVGRVSFAAPALIATAAVPGGLGGA